MWLDEPKLATGCQAGTEQPIRGVKPGRSEGPREAVDCQSAFWRAAGGGYVTPTPSNPKVESACRKTGTKSVLTGHLLGGGRVLPGQPTEEVCVLQAIASVGLCESRLPPRDGDALDADGAGDFLLGEPGGDSQLLPNARRREGTGIHQSIDATQRIRHRALQPRKQFLKRYMK